VLVRRRGPHLIRTGDEGVPDHVDQLGAILVAVGSGAPVRPLFAEA
jgi:hypothetical protein